MKLLYLLVFVIDALDVQQIRPASKLEVGRVVVAPKSEYNHFLRKSSIFLIEHSPKGSWGVNLARPSLLTIGEAAEGIVDGLLGENTLYMGGEYGGRGAFLLHSKQDLNGAKRIGDTDIYLGGIRDAVARVDQGVADPSEFKFFFNVAKWGPGELDRLVDDANEAWHPFHFPADIILSQSSDLDDVELWSQVKKLKFSS